MAVPIVAGDIYEAKFFCSSNNQTGLNVIHFLASTVTGNGGTDQAFASQLDGVVSPAYKALIAATATYYATKVQRISPLPKSLPQISSANQGAGTGGPAALPGQVTGVITWLSNLAGRRNRGRIYVPFPPSALNDNVLDKPTAAYVTALQALATDLTTTYTVGSGGNTTVLTPVIFHRKDATTTFVASFRANQKWGTQRRRGNYGQLNPFPPA